MINYCLILFMIINVYSFQNNFKSYRLTNLKCSNNNKDIKIIDIDFGKLIESFDQEMINNLNGTMPLSPQNEDEIEDDSFEGYLRGHFNKIKDHNNKINFYEFYNWRKYKIGTVLTKDELLEIYNTLVIDKSCDLMNFILLNKIIDENDGADF